MKTNPPSPLTGNSTGLGAVTRQMVRERAFELAIINGRSAQDATKSDWDQAMLELAGASDMDPKAAVLEAAPESEHWDPVPGSTGRKIPVTASADEDEDGRSYNEQMVEIGVAGAEHDQMRRAGLEPAGKRDR